MFSTPFLTREFGMSKRGPRRLPGISVIVAMGLLVIAVLLAVVPQIIARSDPLRVDVTRRLLPPVWLAGGSVSNPLGTDQLGRDILSRIIHGARVSVFVAIAAVGTAGIIGITLGVASGFFGGWVDRVSMRIADVQLAFPAILLAIALAAVLGPGFWKVVIVLTATGWVNFARVVRGAALTLRGQEFVEAARGIGARPSRIVIRHIIPNLLGPTVVIATLELARVIIVEASLGFLGLGVQPPTPSWGNMLSDARNYVATAWWLSTFPGLAIALTCLSVNLVGDWIRDTLDPRLRSLRPFDL
jgi:peptide/nickel transport system permease protein